LRRASSDTYPRIYAVVRRIPRGKVATYGQVAALAGFRRHARQVGYALHAVGNDTTIPWHRVVNARGEVSPRAEPHWEELQRKLLEDEEVFFDSRDRIDLARRQWRPRNASARSVRRG